MTKKILKNIMQKRKERIVYQEKKQTKKKKYVPKHQQNDPKELNSLSQKLQSMSIHDDSQTQIGPIKAQRKSISKKKPVKKTLSKQKSVKKSVKKEIKKEVKNIDEELANAEYKKFLTNLCPLHLVKYHKQKPKQLPLNLEWFKKIKTIWKGDKEEKSQNSRHASKHTKQTVIKKTEKITDVQNITVEFLKRLKPKHWLNDQVINSYIELIELDILKKNAPEIKKDQFTVHLVKTYFAALKMTPQRIDRQIKKRCLTAKSLLIVPINQDYHWFFLVIFDQKIFIFDSILPKSFDNKDLTLSKKVYSMKESVRRCMKLYEKLYKVEQIQLKDFHLVKQYPQQDNQNDCGMMMLCGMKNVITKFLALKRQQDMKSFSTLMDSREFWNFCIQDIKYFRFVFAKELIEEKLLIQ